MTAAMPETTDTAYYYYYYYYYSEAQKIAMNVYSHLYDIVMVCIPPMSLVTNGLSLIVFWRMQSSKQQVS
jgi:hypothetical protein